MGTKPNNEQLKAKNSGNSEQVLISPQAILEAARAEIDKNPSFLRELAQLIAERV